MNSVEDQSRYMDQYWPELIPVIEHRLTHLFQNPKQNNIWNNESIENTWKNYKVPIALGECQRMLDLYNTPDSIYNESKPNEIDSRIAIIRDCITKKKFLSKDLTENEKGIILGCRIIVDGLHGEVFDEDLVQTTYFYHMIY